MIVCGWCGKPSANWTKCSNCGHVGPSLPYTQRGETVVTVPTERRPGRPAVTPEEAQRRLSALGPQATDDQIAAHFEVDPRTVRHWRAKVSG